MAGETYGSPGAAFSGAIEGFLMDQEKLKHQKLLDDLATRREAHQEEIDRLDMEQRGKELDFRLGEEKRRQHKEDVDELQKYLKEDVAPGDIVDKSVIDKNAELGLPPIRLGPIPQKPSGMQPPPSLAEDPNAVPQTMANVPMSPDVGRSYLGTRADEARQKMGDLIASGADPRKIAEGAIRMNVPIPADLSAALGEGTAKAPHDLPQYAAFGPNGKEIPGVVQTDPTGKIMLNGNPVPAGVTVKRVPTPVDPTLEAIRALTLSTKRQEQADKNAPLSSSEQQMAADLANGKMTLTDLQHFYSFQRQGRDRMRAVYESARTMNPSLNPLSVRLESAALGGALNKVTAQKTAVDAYTRAAEKNSQLLDNVLDKIPDTGFSGKPNEWVREANRYLGNEDQVKFNALMTSLQNEYSRIISNPNLTGVVTDATRDELREVAGRDLTKSQIKELFSTLKAESKNRMSGLTEAADNIKTDIGDVSHPPAASKYKVTVE